MRGCDGAHMLLCLPLQCGLQLRGGLRLHQLLNLVQRTVTRLAVQP